MAVSLCFCDMLEWMQAALSLGGRPDSWKKENLNMNNVPRVLSHNNTGYVKKLLQIDP